MGCHGRAELSAIIQKSGRDFKFPAAHTRTGLQFVCFQGPHSRFGDTSTLNAEMESLSTEKEALETGTGFDLKFFLLPVQYNCLRGSCIWFHFQKTPGYWCSKALQQYNSSAWITRYEFIYLGPGWGWRLWASQQLKIQYVYSRIQGDPYGQ